MRPIWNGHITFGLISIPVALLVFDHQMHAINLLTRLNWESRVASSDGDTSESDAAVDRLVRELADYLLFVDEALHRRGVATTLWNLALQRVAPDPATPVEITVNSSDYAIAFYESLGFVRVPFERPIVKRLKFQRTFMPS